MIQVTRSIHSWVSYAMLHFARTENFVPMFTLEPGTKKASSYNLLEPDATACSTAAAAYKNVTQECSEWQSAVASRLGWAGLG